MIKKKKILIVSSGEKLVPVLKELLPVNEYIVNLSTTIHDAKKKLRNESFYFSIVQCPIKDEFGVKSSQEIANTFDIGVLLLVKNDIFDQVTYRLKEDPILVLSMPTNRQVLYQGICLMNTLMFQKQKMENEIRKLRKKIQDQQKINQAKLFLIEQYHYSEEKAHHYIEKVAMDHSITKVEVAMSLIEKVKKNE